MRPIIKKTVFTTIAVYTLITLGLLLVNGCSKHGEDNESEEDQAVFTNEQDPHFTAPNADEFSAGVAKSLGILWKPKADSGGKLVILLNPSWGKPSVQLITVDKKKVIDTGRFVYFSNPNRATYRFNYSGAQLQSKYKQGVLLEIGGKIVARVSKPAGRFE